MQRLIFNGFMVVLGKGWGRERGYYSVFLVKMQETEKLLKSYWKENWKTSNLWLSRVWWISFQFFSNIEMYRKNRVFACKNRANGRGGSAGLGVGLFGKTEKLKRILASAWFSTVWCFSVAFQWLFSGFSETEKCLIFNASQTSLKRLIFNAFTHLLVLGGWVKGRVLSKG